MDDPVPAGGDVDRGKFSSLDPILSPAATA
jgi:hypothetical protein